MTPVRDVPFLIPRPPYLEPGNPTKPEQGFPKHEWLYSEKRKTRIQIKGPGEIEAMRKAGALAREALALAGSLVYPGGTTEAIDAAVHDFICARGAYPSPLGYMGYAKSVCTSVNDVIAHGIPDDRILEQGDIINVDVTVFLDGHHGDTSSMFFVGRPKRSAYELCEAALRARDAGIAVCGPGVDFREVGKAIDKVREEAGCHCSGWLRGHGIGSYFHGSPVIVPTTNDLDQGLMQPGMTFTVEPVLVENNDDTWEMLEDGWTLRTETAAWSAQFEHTVLITDTGHELLTGPTIDYKAVSAAAAKKASS